MTRCLEGSGTSLTNPDILFSKWTPLGCHYPEGKQAQQLLGPSVASLSHQLRVLPGDAQPSASSSIAPGGR